MYAGEFPKEELARKVALLGREHPLLAILHKNNLESLFHGCLKLQLVIVIFVKNIYDFRFYKN